MGFVIRYEYNDLISNKELNQTSWGKLRIDCNSLIKMSKEEKDSLLDSYNKKVIEINDIQ